MLIALLGVDIITVLAGGSSRVAYVIGYGDAYYRYDSWWSGQQALIMIMIFAGIAIFALIMRSRGHYGGNDEITLTFFDRVPLEIYRLVDFCRAMFLVWMLVMSGRFSYYIGRGYEFLFVVLRLIYLLLIFRAVTLAVRCKTGTLISCTVARIVIRWCVKHPLRWCVNTLKALIAKIRYYFDNLTYYWQIAAVAACYGFADMFFLMVCYDSRSMGGYVLWKVISLAALCFLAFRWRISYQKIREGMEIIASGDTGYHVDDYNMPGALAQQAASLNSINLAVANAVQREIKSERLKTELITNVSHDIKTPLTSIINYIDLMGKENIENETLSGYVDVLQRQSARLKKLIEDLVEASKASTGNIQVHTERTGLCLLLTQATGEYQEKSEKRQLTLATMLPEEEVYVMSDGRLLWRVFDNLLNNACKYSQPGTRVYISCEKLGDKAVVTFRNVSKSMLNISPDELMERFVRGDSSRNTEGSGLGLSIAQSLSEMLGGSMNLYIDGDLFKVVLVFPVTDEA